MVDPEGVRAARLPGSTMGEGRIETIVLPLGDLRLEADLGVPSQGEPAGVVVFCHGSGSSRFSPRNRSVARVLREAGLVTLLLDLLTPAEEELDRLTGELRFNVQLLAERVAATVDWLGTSGVVPPLPIGLFGSSTGAAAALVAAAARPETVAAVVSRGGRPDLAGDALAMVQAPTLLLVGEKDPEVVMLNYDALQRLYSPSDLRIIPGASHLFREEGTLEEVARQAAAFFGEHLGAAAGQAPSAPA